MEITLIKPVIDAVIAFFTGGKKAVARYKAEKQLQEALVELLEGNPNITQAEAKIMSAELTGAISGDLIRARERLAKVKEFEAKKATAKKATAKKATAKRAFAKKAPAKKK
jgi:hypothetical protein